MKIRLIINDQMLSATMEDSIPAGEFIAQLPLTLQLEDYAATEKIAQLTRRLSVAGEPEGVTPAAGDIAFYAPWGNLAIFHRPFAYSKGLIRLGRIEGGLQLLRTEGPLAVRIESGQPLFAYPTHHNEVSRMEIKRLGTQASIKGSTDWFTGTVRIDPLNAAPAPSRVSCAAVTFEPGARTAWHTHPLGQTLIVTAGFGWTQCEGGPIVEIRAGDVIWCPPGHKHWHGASPTTAMTHIAVQEALDGRNVDWLEHVTEEQYLAGPNMNWLEKVTDAQYQGD